MRILNLIPILSIAALVSGCGTIISGQTQEITLLTPGAYEAECTLDNGNRYLMRTGETRRIQRTYKPLEVDCYATGDRHMSKSVGAGMNDWALANVSNGVVPGMGYDAHVGGLYEYPDVITMDFVGVPQRGFELPQYHNKDNANPYTQAIEDYGPNTPRIPYDSEYLKRGVQKRDVDINSNPFQRNPSPSITPMPSAGSAGTISAPVPTGGNAEELTRSMNPGVFGN
jgi:hypothetical protein